MPDTRLGFVAADFPEAADAYNALTEKYDHVSPDRADVIIPGADIYLKVVQWAGIKNIFVPVMGLADGVVRILYNDYMMQGADAHTS